MPDRAEDEEQQHLLAAGEITGQTARAALALAAERLREAGLEEPRAEARRLVSLATGRSATDLIARPQSRLSMQEGQSLADALARRCAREPLSRIVGWREFYGRRFEIGPETLDPRPDTELLIDEVLRRLPPPGPPDAPAAPLRILDIGTGTGCIAITLLAELPSAQALATDVLPGALTTARRNAGRLGVSARLETACVRSLEGLEGPFDLIVSNPPYIPAAEIGTLAPEVRCHDPREALDGGVDGLDIYRDIAAGLGDIAAAGALAVFEVGAGQSGEVAAIMERAGHRLAGTAMDLLGHTRTVAVWPLSAGSQ